jgi:hypothetical protein
MNPGIAPSGLFWTARIPSNSVRANPGAGHAVLQASDVHILDFGDFTNSLSGGPSVPAIVSFEVRWSGADERVTIKNPSNGFAGEFVRNSAQMEWSATVGDFRFVSAPLSTSSSGFSEIGTERNGSFYPHA